MLWLGLVLSQQNYSWKLYTSLQNILAHYSIGPVMCFEEKVTKNCENKNNSKGM